MMAITTHALSTHVDIIRYSRVTKHAPSGNRAGFTFVMDTVCIFVPRSMCIELCVVVLRHIIQERRMFVNNINNIYTRFALQRNFRKFSHLSLGLIHIFENIYPASVEETGRFGIEYNASTAGVCVSNMLSWTSAVCKFAFAFLRRQECMYWRPKYVHTFKRRCDRSGLFPKNKGVYQTVAEGSARQSAFQVGGMMNCRISKNSRVFQKS